MESVATSIRDVLQAKPEILNGSSEHVRAQVRLEIQIAVQRNLDPFANRLNGALQPRNEPRDR